MATVGRISGEDSLSSRGFAQLRRRLLPTALVLCVVLAASLAVAWSATGPGFKFFPAWMGTPHDFAFAAALRGKQAYIAGSFGIQRETPGCREVGSGASSKCSWTKVADARGLSVLGIAFSPAGEGIAVGQDGLALRAGVGSDDWQPLKLGLRRRLFAVAASSRGAFVAVGELGTLLYRPAGGQFTPVQTKWQGYSAPNFYDAAFIDPESALVVGEGGWVVTVKNGVMSEAISTAKESLYSVVGCGDWYYAVGQQGLVQSARPGTAKHRPAGSAWRPSRVPGTPDLYSVSCFDQHELITVGPGAVYVATSLGDSPVWQTVVPPLNAQLPWYAAAVPVHSDPGALLAGPGGVWELKLPDGK